MQGSREDSREIFRGGKAVGDTFGEGVSPESERQRQARIRRLRELEAQQIEEHRWRIKEGVRKRRRKSRAYDGSVILAFFCSAALLLISSLIYVGRNADLNTSSRKIVNLKTEYEELKLENDNREEKIISQIDIDEIYRIAIEELGMSYPQKHQVVIYHKTESGYVAQYENIPK